MFSTKHCHLISVRTKQEVNRHADETVINEFTLDLLNFNLINFSIKSRDRASNWSRARNGLFGILTA